MNWGKGIVAGMIVFMLFILSMCFYMFKLPTDEYDHQYYEKGLNFDQTYNKETQVNKDKAWPNLYVSRQHLKIIFVSHAKGLVTFLRPSSTSMDKVFHFDTAPGIDADILLSEIQKGKWQIELEWVNNNKTYLVKQEINIQ